MNRDEQKQAYQAYRLAAQLLYAGPLLDGGGNPIAGTLIKVPEGANVQVVEDGAFVEAVVWVKRS